MGQMSTRDVKRNNSKHYAHSRTDLAVFVNVVFKVVIFGDDCFSDERLVCDADSGYQGGAVCFSQPCDLCGLLEILVVQIQTSLHG